MAANAAVRNDECRTIPATIEGERRARRSGGGTGAPIYDGRVTGFEDSPEPEPIGFWVTRSNDDAGVVLALHGELDVAAAPQLEKLLEETRADRYGHVMVELGGLSFVDSAGLSVLIKAKKEAEEDGAEFILRHPTAQVHRVFALVGMVDWLVFDER